MPGAALNKPSEAARAVAAHLSSAAVAVIKLPGPIGLSADTRHQEDDAVRADPAMPIAQADNLLARKRYRLTAIIQQQEVIPGAAHFCEFQSHRQRIRTVAA